MQSQEGLELSQVGVKHAVGASSLKGDTWGDGGMIPGGEISHDKARQRRVLSNTCEISWGVRPGIS